MPLTPKSARVCAKVIRVTVLLGSVFVIRALPADDQAFKALLGKVSALTDEGHYQAAHEAVGQAIREAESYGPTDLRLAYALNLSGIVNYCLGRFQEAERAYLRGTRIAERSGEIVLLSQLFDNLGELYAEHGDRLAEAEMAKRKALELGVAALGAEHPDVAAMNGNLATLRIARGDLQEARQLLERAAAILETHPGAHPSTEASTLHGLGTVALLEGRPGVGLPQLVRAIELWRTTLGADHPDLVRPLTNLGRVYLKMGNPTLADAQLRQAQDIAEVKLGPSHPALSEILLSRAAAMRKIGARKEARKLERRGRDIAKLHPDRALAHSRIHVSDLRDRSSRTRRKAPAATIDSVR